MDAQLREAKADRKESERDRRMSEAVEQLKRFFPGLLFLTAAKKKFGLTQKGCARVCSRPAVISSVVIQGNPFQPYRSTLGIAFGLTRTLREWHEVITMNDLDQLISDAEPTAEECMRWLLVYSSISTSQPVVIAGVFGRATELAKVTQRKYNLAMAVVMGKDLDSVICDTEATAKECIHWLRQNQVAPMTFFPLNAVRATVWLSLAPSQLCICVMQGPQVCHSDAALARSCIQSKECQLWRLREGVQGQGHLPLNMSSASLSAYVWVVRWIPTIFASSNISMLEHGLVVLLQPVNERLRLLGGTAKVALDLLEYDSQLERAFITICGYARTANSALLSFGLRSFLSISPAES